MSKKYMRDMVPLVVICLVSALLLASFNLLTNRAKQPARRGGNPHPHASHRRQL